MIIFSFHIGEPSSMGGARTSLNPPIDGVCFPSFPLLKGNFHYRSTRQGKIPVFFLNPIHLFTLV
jgi:hypothetical protein